jgi:hypothetical protein
MRDLSALKERIDQAEQQLKATESDRLRESEALMKMWRQIRHRFVTQEQEIAEYRNRIEQLTQRSEELAGLVETMLATIETGAARTRDETPAKIAGMAEQLLTEEFPARTRDAVVEEPAESAMEPEDILELSDAAEDEPEAHFDDDDSPPGLDDSPPESESPGIRSLVRRFESAMHRSSRRQDRQSRSQPLAPTRDEDDDLAPNGDADHGLEDLRKELRGLQRRMTDVAGAP